MNAQGTTILLIEQNANLALSICDYAYLLSVGSIALEGTPQAMKPPRGKPRGIHRIQPNTLSAIGHCVIEAWSA